MRNPDLFRPDSRLRNRKAGYTLVEVLIVILVMSVLMAAALPLYLSSVAYSQEKTCRSNMQTIALAEAAFRTADSAHAYTTNLPDLDGYLGSTPKCPSGGTFTAAVSTGSATAGNGQTVPNGGLVITCSAGHGAYAPGIDGE